MFPIELFSVKTNPAISAGNLGVIFDKNFTFRSHISAVCSSCFYHMRDLRHIYHHLDLDSAKLLSTAIVSSRLDYCNSLLYGIANIDLARFHTCSESTGLPADKVSSIYSQCSTFHSLHWWPVRFRILFKINLLIYKTLHEKQPVYLHSMLAVSLPPVHRDQTTIIVCQSLGSRPTQVQEHFTLAPRLFGTTSHCLSVQLIQLLPSRNIWRHISLTWPLLHRYRHARWPVDVAELFPQFCCWTLIRLLHQWAWLHQGYWCYRRFNWINFLHFDNILKQFGNLGTRRAFTGNWLNPLFALNGELMR